MGNRVGKTMLTIISLDAKMSAFGGKADMPFCTAHVRL